MNGSVLFPVIASILILASLVGVQSSFGFSLTTTIHNPTPEDVEFFGRPIVIIGDRILIGSARDNTGGQDAGAAYLYDSTGQLLHSFNTPTPGLPGFAKGNLHLMEIEFYFPIKMTIL